MDTYFSRIALGLYDCNGKGHTFEWGQEGWDGKGIFLWELGYLLSAFFLGGMGPHLDNMKG